jgi:hypothetical protein
MYQTRFNGAIGLMHPLATFSIPYQITKLHKRGIIQTIFICASLSSSFLKLHYSNTIWHPPLSSRNASSIVSCGWQLDSYNLQQPSDFVTFFCNDIQKLIFQSRFYSGAWSRKIVMLPAPDNFSDHCLHLQLPIFMTKLQKLATTKFLNCTFTEIKTVKKFIFSY